MADTWEWHADWAHLDEVPGAATAFAHHGLAVLDDGSVVGFHARQLVIWDADGHVARRAEPGLFEGHQITVDRSTGDELLWIADPGICLHTKPDGNFGHGLELVGGAGRAALVSLDGKVLREIGRPPLDDGVFYMPTSVAVVDRGTHHEIWVADGYGSSLVHRYDSDGQLLDTIDGTNGAGRFDCPHAVFADTRTANTRVCVADRGNARVQVFDAEGGFLDSFGQSILTSPSSFAVWGDTLAVAELRARVALFDRENALIDIVGDNEAVADEPGWPNELDADGNAVRTSRLIDGKFNSPHAVAFDDDGNLFVAEWLLGGRYNKLVRRNVG